MKLKAFFIIHKGLSLKQIKHFFLEGKSPTLRLEVKSGDDPLQSGALLKAVISNF